MWGHLNVGIMFGAFDLSTFAADLMASPLWTIICCSASCRPIPPLKECDALHPIRL